MIRTYALWGGSPLSRIILIILIVDVIVSALLPHRRLTEANSTAIPIGGLHTQHRYRSTRS